MARFELPILVSENGICTQNDEQRWVFIQSHLAQTWRALLEGVPIFGYLYWSLLDNFEWAEGFDPRFGLVEMDYHSMARRVRESGVRYAEICESGEVPLDSQPVSV